MVRPQQVDLTVNTINLFQTKCKIQCKCTAREVVVYYCAEEKCSLHISNPLYCLSCLQNSVHNHNTPHLYISKELQKFDKHWADKKEELAKVNEKASKRYSELQPLIVHFEAESSVHASGKNFTSDITTLQNYVKRFSQFSEEIERHITNCDLLQIIARQSAFVQISNECSKLTYLMDLTE